MHHFVNSVGVLEQKSYTSLGVNDLLVGMDNTSIEQSRKFVGFMG